MYHESVTRIATSYEVHPAVGKDFPESATLVPIFELASLTQASIYWVMG